MATYPVPVTIRVTVERLVAGGDGLARDDDGRVVFVPGTAPGDVVDVRLERERRDVAFGLVEAVVAPGPGRVAPPCPARRAGCGGCGWQHVDPDAQLGLKVDIVREALRRTARLPADVVDDLVVPGGSVPPWAYRTTMRFALDRTGRPALRRARSNDLVDPSGCLIAHPSVAAAIDEVAVPGADEVTIRTGASSGDLAVWWSPERVPARRLPADATAGAAATVREVVDGVEFTVSASSFFQSGPDAATLLVRTVRDLGGDALASARSVVDAYGGVGLFAATVVPNAARVVLVEVSSSSCRDARAQLAGRDASVVRSTVERWTPSAADVVIADPARQGLGADAVDRLDRTGAATLLLVSCDPVSFARDTGLLAARGWHPSRSVVLDLFPQTHHVEVVTRFDRRHS